MNIKLKLISLLLVIGLIPTLAVGIVSYITISRELRSNTANQLESISVKQEQKIDSLLQIKQEEVSKLVNQFDLQVALGRYLATGDKADYAALARLLSTAQIETPEMQTIALGDLKGSTLISTTEGEAGKPIAGSEIIGSEESSIVSIKEDSRDGVDKLYITTRVSVNKQEAALMTVIFRIDDIVATVQDYTGLGTTGETLIVADTNTSSDTISLFPLRFNTDAALHTQLNSLDILKHTDGKVYSGIKDYQGAESIVVARPLGFANWVMAVKIDSSEALAPIQELQRSLVGIAIASSIIIIAIALYFARFFSEPILQIARISKRIGQGEFDARAVVHRHDEVGALAESINSMGMSLKEFVQHIERQRNRLQVILDSTEESIIAIDANHIIRTVNKATALLTDQPIDQIIGKSITEVFQWTHNGKLASISYDTPGTNNFDNLQYKDTSGSVHYVKLSVTRLESIRQGHETQAIVTVYDETKSRDLDNMKIDFVSMAAHELRTPLAAIRGYLELITYKEASNTSTEVQKYLLQAIKSTSELGSLISNLLDVTRIERGALSLNLDRVDLAAGVTKAVNDAGFAARDKQITLQYTGPTEGCFIMGDEIAIHEVINNLLANAIKYTNRNGRVSVVLQKKANEYSVSVSDNGIGIPKSAIGNLFTKFYRVKGGLNSGSTGTGLGLFIAKSIVERHNGSIGVTSKEGVGSTFTFVLPALSTTANTAHVQQEIDNTLITRRKRGWITKNITR